MNPLLQYKDKQIDRNGKIILYYFDIPAMFPQKVSYFCKHHA